MHENSAGCSVLLFASQALSCIILFFLYLENVIFRYSRRGSLVHAFRNVHWHFLLSFLLSGKKSQLLKIGKNFSPGGGVSVQEFLPSSHFYQIFPPRVREFDHIEQIP